MMKKVSPKSLSEMCDEWNLVCHRRHSAIKEGRDISLISVTTPCIIRHIRIDHPTTVLDVGCGTGYLTSLISRYVHTCIGIDLSEQSIALANTYYSSSNVEFKRAEISKYYSNTPFDTCVANMVFMSDPNWTESVKHLYELLAPNGKLYIMIAHPCFWPKYWGYEAAEWFHYNEEIYIENDFSISFEKSMGRTTFIHRSLTQYLTELLSAGFRIDTIEEPYPTKYTPEAYEYSYPRFLFIKCVK